MPVEEEEEEESFFAEGHIKGRSPCFVFSM